MLTDAPVTEKEVAAPDAVLDASRILANVRALRPMLQARGNEIDELRRIPDDILEAVRGTGAFRMMMPASWGGPEMNPMQINDALEELACGNGAVAWCVMIQIDSGQYSGFLPADSARRFYADLDATTSNVIRPAGQARPVKGGYIVNGRWPFASGCQHADLFAGGCHIFEEGSDKPLLDAEGHPRHLMVVAPKDAFVIHDTWYTTGLRGTGSNDIEAKDLFIPADQAFSFDQQSHEGALYLWPAVLVAKMPGVVLGIARSAIEWVTMLMRTRRNRSELTALGIAEAQTLYASSRAYVHKSLEDVWARLEKGQLPTEQERAAVYLARANAFQSCRQAVQLMFDTFGGSAIYGKKSPIERHLRDLNTACQHTFGQQRAQVSAAQLLLGTLEKPVQFL